MIATFPSLKIGSPLSYGSLSVFPLFSDVQSDLEYLLSEEALAKENLGVEEISEGGSVPELLVRNKGDLRVLFLEGEQLIGAKQNRVLNTSLFVPARTETKIPVSCVEQGRWRYTTAAFESSDMHCTPKMRSALKGSVNLSLLHGGGHRSDQGSVWREVSRQQTAMNSSSDTVAMADTYSHYAARIKEFRDRFKYVADSRGLAVAVGETIVAVDLFDHPRTCEKVWSRLLSGYAMQALETEANTPPPAEEAVAEFIEAAQSLHWIPAQASGEGEDFRADSENTHASALWLEGTLVHGSVVLAG